MTPMMVRCSAACGFRGARRIPNGVEISSRHWERREASAGLGLLGWLEQQDGGAPPGHSLKTGEHAAGAAKESHGGYLHGWSAKSSAWLHTV